MKQCQITISLSESYTHFLSCLILLNFVVNLVLQCWHPNVFSWLPLCTFKCRFKDDCAANSLLHIWHLCFSWWIALECLFNASWLAKVLSHSVHIHSWQFFSWYVASFALGNDLWHVLHLYDVIPQSISSLISCPFFFQSYQRQKA